MGGCKTGVATLKFLADGQVYTFDKHPVLSTEGLMSATKSQVFYDEATITDQRNGLVAAF